jgi:hypothetical protein
MRYFNMQVRQVQAALHLCKFISLSLTFNCSLGTNLWHCHDMQYYLLTDLSTVLLSQLRGYV